VGRHLHGLPRLLDLTGGGPEAGLSDIFPRHRLGLWVPDTERGLVSLMTLTDHKPRGPPA
jgi:hypothetical protein